MKIFLFILVLIFSCFLPRRVPIMYHLIFLILLYYPNYPYDVFTAFLYCLFLQDLQTMYISKHWIAPSLLIGFLILYKYWNITSSILALILYVFPISIMYLLKKEWMGCADLYYISYFSIILGYQRLSVTLLISTLSALLFCLCFKKREVPFLSFLSIGVYISCICGYQIWYELFDIFWRCF